MSMLKWMWQFLEAWLDKMENYYIVRIMFCSLTNTMSYVFYILVTFRSAIGP